jgi:hypothetical protein
MLGRPHSPTVPSVTSRARRPRWTRAVNTQPPTLHEAVGDRATGSANIQCWRGTVDELCIPVTELVQAVASTGGTQRAEITWADGSRQVEADVESLRRALKERKPDDLLMVRFVVAAGDGSVEGTLLARAKLPGITLEVTGINRAQVLGIAELVFQQMMIGYVDRVGGWRLPMWMLTAYIPGILIVTAVNRAHVSSKPIIVIPLILLTIVILILTMSLSYEALIVKKPLKIEATPILQRRERTASWIRTTYRRPVTRRVLYIIGTLIIGVLASELATVIPWPWDG